MGRLRSAATPRRGSHVGRDTQDCRWIGPSFMITSGITSAGHNATQSYWPIYTFKRSGRNQLKSSSWENQAASPSVPRRWQDDEHTHAHTIITATPSTGAEVSAPTTFEEFLQRAMSIETDLDQDNRALHDRFLQHSDSFSKPHTYSVIGPFDCCSVEDT